MNSFDMSQLIALAAALGWASGVRLYLVVLLVGLAGYLGWVPLPGGLHVLAHPIVLAVSGFLVFVEFFADKIPGLDSLWDMVHTAIRIPAGAALAASVFGADHAVMAVVAALLGAAVLGEHLGIGGGIAFGLILLGSWLSTRGARGSSGALRAAPLET